MKMKACLAIPPVFFIYYPAAAFFRCIAATIWIGDFFLFFFYNWHTINSPPQGFFTAGVVKKQQVKLLD